MLSKEAITALQESQSIMAAHQAIAHASDSRDLAALPSDYSLHDLEAFLPARRRARGTMKTSVLASFADYTTAHGELGCAVFIDPMSMQAVSVLNLGEPTQPGHADNKAVLELKKTAAYQALLTYACGNPLKQSQIAEFLEDWADHLTCSNDAGAIATPKAIAAIRKITIEAMRKLESTEQQLSASLSTFESAQATSTEPLPTQINFTCQPYADLSDRTFSLRLGIQTGNDKPAITLRIIKIEQHTEDMANELAELVAGQFESDTNIAVILGTYSKTN